MIKLSGVTPLLEELSLKVDLEQGGQIPLDEGIERDLAVSALIEELDKEGKLLNCWANATRMRRWMLMKKQSLGERFKSN